MPKFGDLEAVIMDQVWRFDGRVRVRDIVTAIQRERDIAFTTVQTVMNILHGKGWLDREKAGRAYLYWAAKPREEYTAMLLSEALDTTADRGAAFSRLLDTLEPAEIGELRQALDQAKARESAAPVATKREARP